MSDVEQHFSAQEVARALSRLGRTDAVRLAFIARAWARRFDAALADDLLNEAIARVMDGRRLWPLSQDLFTFMSGVMRSISFEWRKRLARETPICDEELIALAPPLRADQEAVAAFAQVRAQVMGALADDPTAAAMFTLKLSDAPAAEIAAALGLAPTDYDTVSRRLKRQLFRLFPEGAPL